MNNWTKADVEFINNELNNRSMVARKGVVFVVAKSNSDDEFHKGMSQVVKQMGGAAVVEMDYDRVGELLVGIPSDALKELHKLATPVDGRFLTVFFVDKWFDDKFDHERFFVIAHELGHLHYGDHRSEEHRLVTGSLSDYKGNQQHEYRADEYAVELLGTKSNALAFFRHIEKKIASADSSTLNTEQQSVFHQQVSNLKNRHESILWI